MHYSRPENKYWMLRLCLVKAQSGLPSHSIIDYAFHCVGDAPTCTGEIPWLVYLLLLFLKVSKNSSSNGFGMFITAEDLFPMLRPHQRASSPGYFSLQALRMGCYICIKRGNCSDGTTHSHHHWERWALLTC